MSNTSDYFFDSRRTCPDCASAGGLRYLEVPPSQRHHSSNGEEHTHHFGLSRDYECSNCGCEFTLTAWEDA